MLSEDYGVPLTRGTAAGYAKMLHEGTNAIYADVDGWYSSRSGRRDIHLLNTIGTAAEEGYVKEVRGT